MINERYEQYERRMLLLSRIWKWIKKYYKVAILPPVTALVLLLTFLGMIGIFIGELEIKDYVYGSTPEVSGKAFLSKVYYEYSDGTSEDGWSTRLPVRAGEYQVRAVSKNGYGNW